MSLQAYLIHADGGWRPALVKQGRTRYRAVVITAAGLRVLSVPLTATAFGLPLSLRGAPYPVERLRRELRRIARARGATAAALAILSGD